MTHIVKAAAVIATIGGFTASVYSLAMQALLITLPSF